MMDEKIRAMESMTEEIKTETAELASEAEEKVAKLTTKKKAKA